MQIYCIFSEKFYDYRKKWELFSIVSLKNPRNKSATFANYAYL